MNKKIKIPEIKIKVSLTKGEPFLITSSQVCYETFQLLIDKNTFYFKEEMILLALNRANLVYGYYRVSSGGRSGTVVDPKIIYTILLNANACSFIIAHNHPSGNLAPSEADKAITRKLVKAGELLDINLFDHLIITDNGYLSFKDEGLL